MLDVVSGKLHIVSSMLQVSASREQVEGCSCSSVQAAGLLESGFKVIFSIVDICGLAYC